MKLLRMKEVLIILVPRVSGRLGCNLFTCWTKFLIHLNGELEPVGLAKLISILYLLYFSTIVSAKSCAYSSLKARSSCKKIWIEKNEES